MKNVALTVAGNRYEVKLEDDFADFVYRDLQAAGVNLNTDNKPDKLLRAYLRLVKKTIDYENEIELLIDTLEGL